MIGSQRPRGRDWITFPLFRFEILVVMPMEHRLRARRQIAASDLDRGDAHYLSGAGRPDRPDTRGSAACADSLEAADRRVDDRHSAVGCEPAGIAALPNWGVKNYVDLDYVLAKRIGAKGLWSDLYAVAPRSLGTKPYVAELAAIIRAKCASQLNRIELL